MADDGLKLEYLKDAPGSLDVTVITGIEGLGELEEALTSGSKRAAKKFLRKAEMQAANLLVESARTFAPQRSGNLEQDIHRQSLIMDNALTVRVGPSQDAFYGMFQEFGAPEAGVAAQHWLEESAKKVQDAVLETLCDCLTEGLEDMKR